MSTFAADEISMEDAEEFIHDLHSSGVLVSRLSPAITGGDPLDHVLQH